MGKNLLVVGDVMIERTWVVPPSEQVAPRLTYEAVLARKLLEPNRKTDVTGGAGTIARAIRASGHTSADQPDVVLAGGWAVRDSMEKLLPPDSNGIDCRRLAETEFTSLRWRIYTKMGNEYQLRWRFDRDLDSSDKYTRTKKRLPAGRIPDGVVVADFGKGLLDQSWIRRDLKQYKGKPFVLRTRGLITALAAHLPWTVLVISRGDLQKVVSNDGLVPDTVVKKTSGGWSVAPDLLAMLTRLRRVVSGRPIIVWLYPAGAVLLDEQAVVRVVPPRDLIHDRKRLIGTTDVMMAHLAVELAQGGHVREGLRKGIAAAVAYLKGEDMLLNHDGWYGTTVKVEPREDVELAEAGRLATLIIFDKRRI